MSYRIGFGYDVHQLAEGEKFWLGGIIIPHFKGCVAHSDGDALIHAICDALLGAANLNDIGYHFPDSDEKYKNIDSKVLLKETMKLIRNKGYSVGNIDTTVCLQKPKIRPFIEDMQKTLAGIMDIDAGNLNIKATTTEKLGFVGNEEGIACYAVALIQNN
jgi:2-C-methyl-D-erythritol 2,4-cyclodiphosphate synthase